MEATVAEDLACAFCTKTRREVSHLVAAATGSVICNECIASCVVLLLRTKLAPKEGSVIQPLHDPKCDRKGENCALCAQEKTQ